MSWHPSPPDREPSRDAYLSTWMLVTEEDAIDFLGAQPSLAYWHRQERLAIYGHSLTARLHRVQGFLRSIPRRLAHARDAILDRPCRESNW